MQTTTTTTTTTTRNGRTFAQWCSDVSAHLVSEVGMTLDALDVCDGSLHSEFSAGDSAYDTAVAIIADRHDDIEAAA